MVRRPAVTTAAAIFYTHLTAGIFSEEKCPQAQVRIDYMVCHVANNRVVSVIEGLEAIVDAKGVPAGVYM